MISENKSNLLLDKRRHRREHSVASAWTLSPCSPSSRADASPPKKRRPPSKNEKNKRRRGHHGKITTTLVCILHTYTSRVYM